MNLLDTRIRIAGLVHDSIVDGPGIRCTIFCQGCARKCHGCHNPQTHSFSGGAEYTVAQLLSFVQKNPLCKGVTFSGGDPMYQPHGFAAFAQKLKALHYEVACYTGFVWEELMQDSSDEGTVRRRLLQYTDILIDGPFVLAQKNLGLRFRGSANQRIIDVQASLAQKESTGDISPVLCKQKRWTGE